MDVSISVRSQDRISGDRDSFSVALPENIQFKHVALVDAEIPLSWYTIGARNQFTLGEWDNVTIKWASIYLRQGVITDLETLRVELKAALDSQSPHGTTYTVTYDRYTDKFTITGAGMRNIWLQFDDSNIADIMGFQRGVQYTGNDSPTITSLYSPMLAPQDLYLYIPELPTKGMMARKTGGAYTFKLALNGQRYYITDYLGYQHQQNVNNQQPLTINKMSVSLKDGDGAAVSMRSDWSFTLKFSNC